MGNWGSRQALEYHERTKHSYVSVRLGSRRLDWANYPYPFKVYREAPGLELPRSFPRPEAPALGLQLTGQGGGSLGLERVAELLFYSAGITRVKDYPGMRVYFRAASATGALYETEIYAANASLPGLPAGVYHFDPGEFRLDLLREGEHRWAVAEALADKERASAPLTFIFSSMAWRNAWKYEARSYRHWFWDAGTILANMLCICAAEGLGAYVMLGFLDDGLNELLGLDGREEAAIALLTVGPGQGAPPRGPLGRLRASALPLSRASLRYPLVEEAYESSKLVSREELERWARACAQGVREGGPRPGIRAALSLPRVSPPSPPLWQVILRRGSAREFSRRPITLAQLSAILRTMAAPLPCDFLRASRRLAHIYLIANAVLDLAPGAYFYDAEREELCQLRQGEMRELAGYLCLEQALGADAAAVLFLMGDLAEIVEGLGNRGYRACQLEAGIRAGLAYLAAYSLSLGATGLTFYDDDVRECFLPHAEGRECLLVVAVGVPAYRSRPGRIYAGAVKHDRRGPVARALG